LTPSFAANEERFNNDEKKVLFAISYLSGATFSYMEPYLSKLDLPAHLRPSILTNFSTFKDPIISAFGDSNAGAALRNLKQTGPAYVYSTEFRHLSMLVTWNDATSLLSVYIGSQGYGTG
jgi:hypothetical protein